MKKFPIQIKLKRNYRSEISGRFHSYRGTVVWRILVQNYIERPNVDLCGSATGKGRTTVLFKGRVPLILLYEMPVT